MIRKSCRFPVFFLSFFLIFSCMLAPVCSAGAESEENSIKEPGIDLVLVIDISGSMKGSDPEYLCLEAARRCIDEIQSVDGSRVSIIPFSDQLGEITPLTRLSSEKGRKRISSALEKITYSEGDTDIGLAMSRALEMLTDDEDRPDGKYAENLGWVVLLTDGEIDLPQAENEQEAEKKSLTEALLAVECAKQNSIFIDTVALRVTGRVDENLMNYMADMTGGSFHMVEDASELPDLYEELPKTAREEIPEAETEPETETERETETETETEEETEPPLVLSGNIDGKVVLDGLFPPLCRGNLDLSGLFRSGRPGRLSYMAYTQTEGIADCRLDGAVLSLTGRSNGMTKVIVRAETEDGYTLETEFYIQIKALFSSLWYLAVIPAAAAGVILLIILVRRASDTDYSKAELFGSLCWYVKGEGEKIYGVPSNQTTDLSEYGSRVSLADFAEDELLEGAELKKVVFTAGKDYVRVRCRGRSCRLYSEESGICDRLELEDGCSFRILCEGDEGKAAVICLYSSDAENEMDTEEEDEGERTRLLI